MKKIIAAVLIAAIALCITGCGRLAGLYDARSRPENDAPQNEASSYPLPDPFDTFEAGLNSIRDASLQGPIRCNVDQKTESSIEGVKMTFEIYGETIFDTRDSIRMSIRKEKRGTFSNKTEAFYLEDETYYVYTSDDRSTYRLKLDEATKQALQKAGGADTLSLGGSVPLAQSIAATSKGGYEIRLSFDPSDPNVISQILPTLDKNTTGLDISFHRIDLTANIDSDGVLKTLRYELEMSGTQDGVSVDMDMDMTAAYHFMDPSYTVRPPMEIDIANAKKGY